MPIFPTRDEHWSTHFAEQGAAGAHVQRHGETTIAGSELAARHDVTVVAGELGNHDARSRRTAGVSPIGNNRASDAKELDTVEHATKVFPIALHDTTLLSTL